MIVSELVVMSSVNYYFNTLGSGRSAILLIPRGVFAPKWLVLCTRVFMLKKSSALEWLALWLVCCVLDVGSTLPHRFFCRLDDVHPWQHDLHHYFWFCFVQKPRTISALLWTWSKKEVIYWLCFVLYHNWVWQKLITMKWFRVLWLCPFLGITPSDVCQEFETSLAR